MAYGLILPKGVRTTQPLSQVPLLDSVWSKDGLVWAGSSIYTTQGRLQGGVGPSFTGSFSSTQLGREITSDGPALRRGTSYGDHLAYFPGTVSSNGCCSVVLRFLYTKSGTAYQIWASANNYTVAGCLYVEILATGEVRFLLRGHGALTTSALVTAPNTWYTLAFRVGRSPPEGTGVRDIVAYLDGIHLLETTPDSSTSPFVQTGGQSIVQGRDSTFASLFTVTHAGVDKESLQNLSRNPWQLFEPDDTPVFYSLGGAAAELAADATAAVSASGAITTGIPLAGAALLSSASTGSLSTAVQLAAQALAGGQALGDLSTAITLQGAVATATLASGDLSAQIRLDGAALAAAIASAGLTASILLAAAAQGGAQAAGSLSTGEGLEGVATGAAQATGSLTTLIVLSGAAVAALLASGDLSTTPSGLVGAATAGAQASGAITTAIPLAGGAQVSVIATGDAATGVTLAGAAVAVVAATGDLVIALELSAQALASAIAGADLTTAVVMRADAVVGAQAGGTLAGVVYIASTRRTYVAPRRVRRAIAGMR